MKKKISVLLAFIVIVSGCGLPLSQTITQKFLKTNNGSVIFSRDTDIKKLCNKSELDKFTSENASSAIKDEFRITNYNDLLYVNNKDKFTSAALTGSDCQYQPYYFDFTRQANRIEIGKLDLNKDDVIEIDKLLKDKSVVEFTNSNPLTVVGITTKMIIDSKINESYLQSDLNVSKTGKYKLYAKPVYRMYHFIDKKLINDYDFSGIRGLTFELELIK